MDNNTFLLRLLGIGIVSGIAYHYIDWEKVGAQKVKIFGENHSAHQPKRTDTLAVERASNWQEKENGIQKRFARISKSGNISLLKEKSTGHAYVQEGSGKPFGVHYPTINQQTGESVALFMPVSDYKKAFKYEGKNYLLTSSEDFEAVGDDWTTYLGSENCFSNTRDLFTIDHCVRLYKYLGIKQPVVAREFILKKREEFKLAQQRKHQENILKGQIKYGFSNGYDKWVPIVSSMSAGRNPFGTGLVSLNIEITSGRGDINTRTVFHCETGKTYYDREFIRNVYGFPPEELFRWACNKYGFYPMPYE